MWQIVHGGILSMSTQVPRRWKSQRVQTSYFAIIISAGALCSLKGPSKSLHWHKKDLLDHGCQLLLARRAPSQYRPGQCGQLVPHRVFQPVERRGPEIRGPASAQIDFECLARARARRHSVLPLLFCTGADVGRKGFLTNSWADRLPLQLSLPLCCQPATLCSQVG